MKQQSPKSTPQKYNTNDEEFTSQHAIADSLHLFEDVDTSIFDGMDLFGEDK